MEHQSPARCARRHGMVAATTLSLCLGALPGAALAQGGVVAQCTNASPGHSDFGSMVVGFSQSENEQNPFRAAETASVRAAARQAGVRRLLYTNAEASQAKQVSDIESMIAQGAQALIIAPLNATGLQPALAQAAQRHIPVVTIDRLTSGVPCHDYITYMGSDFYRQGQRAADALVAATGGHARILEIQGAYGNSVETQRTQGFADQLKSHPGMTIVSAQSGNWATTDAQTVMEQMLLAHPDVNALYTQADVMALGAIRAIRQSGRQPGKDIKIVSIDGTRAIVTLINAGQVQADIETNPRFGPRAFDALAAWFAGKPVPQTVTMTDTLYTNANAGTAISGGAAY